MVSTAVSKLQLKKYEAENQVSIPTRLRSFEIKKLIKDFFSYFPPLAIISVQSCSIFIGYSSPSSEKFCRAVFDRSNLED